MTEKKPITSDPEFNAQLRAGSQDITEFMAGVRADREKPTEPDIQEDSSTVVDTENVVAIGAAASRRLTLVEADPEPLNAYEDLGGGNPQKRRFDSLRADLLHNIEIIETDGALYANGDWNVFKLVEGVKVIRGIFDYPGWDIKKSVNHAVNEFQKTGGEKFKRNRTVILHDSLGSLQAAFRHTIKNRTTHERNEELVEQFTEDICPSGLWGEVKLTEAMLESIDQAYEMVANMTSYDQKSIEGFIKKMQMELLKQGLGIDYARGQSQSVKSRNDQRLANARILAGQEWQESGHETSA